MRALSEVRKEQLVGFFSCCVAAQLPRRMESMRLLVALFWVCSNMHTECLCLGINALQYHFIQASAYFLFIPEWFPIPGAPGDSSGEIPGNYSNSPAWALGRREQVYLGNWLSRHMDQQKANEQQVRLQWWSPSSRPPYSAETRPTPPLPAQHLMCFHRISVG